MKKSENEPFYFGASSSAHQVEGGQKNDWVVWERRTAKSKARMAKSKTWPPYISENYPSPLDEENYISGKAADHWNRYEEDFDIARSLGHSAHRFSIEWSRVEPEEGKFDERALRYYRDVVRALRARGMEPFVTLWHFTLPVWFSARGGWESRGAAECFARYVGRVAAFLGKDVTFWIILNEPEIYAHMAYLIGAWPPQKKNPFRTLAVLSRLIRGHRAAHSALKRLNPSARVGIAKNNIHFEAAGDSQWNKILKACADWWWNFFVLNRFKDTLDFIGVNFYFHNRISGWFSRNRNEKVSDLGWELAPGSLSRVLAALKKYRKPLYVTESGLADARDLHRAEFIRESLRAVRRAMEEGADVRGYFHWSLTDNFEWADGFWPRFGLIAIDYKTLARKVRPSAYVYRDLIKGWKNF